MFSIMLVMLLLAIWLILHLVFRSKPIRGPFVVSHRGAAALAPENTLAGISEAINQRALFVEVDVQRTADNTLVLMHNRTVDRTTDGTGMIGELTWGEISRLDAGSHFSSSFAGEPIPTLNSVLELIIEKQVTLVLEVKDPKLYPGIEQQVAEALKSFKAYDRVIVISFDHDWLDHFHRIAPEISLGRLGVWTRNSEKLPVHSLVDVHWTNVIADPTLVRRSHNQGHTVVVWTVNSARLMRLLLRLGVDGITTDRPDLWTEVTCMHQ